MGTRFEQLENASVFGNGAIKKEVA